MSFFGLFLFLLFLFYEWDQISLKSFNQVKQEYKPSDIWLVDRNQVPLESLRQNPQKRNLSWTSIQDISPAFIGLLITAEDQRFYTHRGFDPLALLHSLYDGLFRSFNFRGASTLSMQLSGLIERKHKIKSKSLQYKLLQILYSIKLETLWKKDEILEAYVNLVPFRGEIVGLKAASLGFFNKNPSGLNEIDSSILVSLLRSPNSHHSLVAKRACNLLKHNREIDCKTISKISEDLLTKPYQLNRTRELIPVFSEKFTFPKTHIQDEKNSDKSVIKTTLDKSIQQLAMSSLKQQINSLKNQNVRDGSVLILDAKSGEVLAYAANGGPFDSSAPQVDGVRSFRQAGSTIKPFVYATALELGLLKPNSILDDSPMDITISNGRVYQPKNYDHVFRGYVGLGEALASSLNVPAVKVLSLVGETRVLDHLRVLGFEHLERDEYYGPSLALGAVDVSLWEITQGYRAFFSENSPFSKTTRDALFNILSAPEYRRYTFGIDNVLSLPFRAFVKTGTSKDMRDNWCIGGTNQFVIGVWIGNFKGDPMWGVSGLSGAAPIWRELMIALHNERPNIQTTHYLPPEKPLLQRSMSRIRYPVHDMMIAYDPDIPSTSQKLPIEIENPQPHQNVFINNKILGPSKEFLVFPLRRGQFHIQLKTSQGKLVDEATYQVR